MPPVEIADAKLAPPSIGGPLLTAPTKPEGLWGNYVNINYENIQVDGNWGNYGPQCGSAQGASKVTP